MLGVGIVQYLQGLEYRGADKSLAWPTSRCILFDGENISFDDMIYLLTAIGLSPGGSTHLHTNNT